MSISEKSVENQVLSYLRRKGIFCWKNHTTGIFDPTKRVFRKSNNPFLINGVSDILGVFQGRFMAIEVKRPFISAKTKQVKHKTQEELEKLASDDQLLFMQTIKKHGGIAFMVDSLDVLEEQLQLWDVTT